MQRRKFLITIAGALTGGLRLDFSWADSGAQSDRWAPHAVLEIESNGGVVVRVAKSEMGQGVLTALPMLVAEELDVPWQNVRCELAPGAVPFRDARGNQATGYSSSVSSSFLPLRQLGAATRQLLVQAAAERWGAGAGALSTSAGFVVDAATGRRLPYGELLAAASRLPVPAEVSLRPRAQWRLLGQELARVDTPAKVDGTAQFGLDVRLPGMLVGVVARAPAAGLVPTEMQLQAARAVPGFAGVAHISSGVAVLASSFPAADKARSALKIRWPDSRRASSAEMRQQLERALEKQPGIEARSPSAPAPAEERERSWHARYYTPFLAHAAMEPLSCTVHIQPDRCDIWLGTQAPSRAQDWGARLTGLPLDRVFVHTMLIGGAFGRRGEADYVVEAIESARQVGRPVKIIWTRDDDMRHDFYRPMTANAVSGRIAADGRWLALEHRLAASSIARRRSPDMLKSSTDFLMTQGSSDLHYDLTDVRVSYREVDLGVPVGFWRSVGHSHNGFVIESFVDELAHLAHRDALEFRLAQLAGEPRMQGVLLAAAERAGWGAARATGRSLGIACMKSYGTYVAEVVEMRRVEGQARISGVWCAVDCGQVVNPAIVRQQMMSGIVFGLSAALGGAITHRDGRVEQSNFHDYPVLRMQDTPPIDVTIVLSDAEPGGCGEPSTPVIAPAVANAYFSLTGERQRELPLRF